MNRLQKKCFIAATGFHLLLAVIVVIGPAFLSSSSKPVDVPLIDIIPAKTVDALVMNRGAGSPQPPTQNPQPPVPTPPAPPVPDVAPPDPVPDPPKAVKDPVKEIKPEPKDDPAPVPAKVKPRPLPNVSTTIVKPKPSANTEAQQRAAEARAAADARAKQDAIHSIASIGNSLSKPTKIELGSGGGGTGVSYANFLQAVKKVYTDAWIVPDGINDDSATVSVTVTIARDGTVVSARIIQRSGNGSVDHSVQMTLDRVPRVVPLPDDAKEDQRTVTIDFNVKAKLLG